MVPLNAKIPAELRRRLLIAKANTGKTIQEMLMEWIEAGLTKLEKSDKR